MLRASVGADDLGGGRLRRDAQGVLMSRSAFHVASSPFPVPHGFRYVEWAMMGPLARRHPSEGEGEGNLLAHQLIV